MYRSMPLAYLSAVLGVLLSEVPAMAEPIRWTYAANALPDLLASPDGSPNSGAPLGMNAYGVSIYRDIVGPNDIRLVNLSTYNLAWSQGPATISFNNAPYSIRLTLTDTASQLSGLLTFNGILNGFANEGDHVSSITSTFVGSTTQSLKVGENRYTVGMLSPDPLLHWAPQPNNPVNKFFGTIDAHVNVAPASGPRATPEPSCLVLAGIGLVTVAGAAWRNRHLKAGPQK